MYCGGTIRISHHTNINWPVVLFDILEGWGTGSVLE